MSGLKALTFIDYSGLWPGIIYPLSVYIASINYWRHPINDWRRYFDIACSVTSLICQTVQAINHPNFMLYILVMSLTVLFYQLSFYFQHRYLPLSTLSHSLIHIFGNIANYILYSETDEACVNENARINENAYISQIIDEK